MKKAIKIILISLLVIIAITYYICLFTIPTETKEFTDKVLAWLNTPIGIGIGCTITVGGVIYFVGGVIINKTTIGAKGKKELDTEFNKCKEKVIAFENKVDSSLKELDEKGKEQLAVLTAYSVQIDEIKDTLIKVCKTSPNAKIKALGEQAETKINEVKQETIDTLTKKENEYAEIVFEKVEDIKQIKEQYKAVLDELNALKEKLENSYGEGKDSSSNEE